MRRVALLIVTTFCVPLQRIAGQEPGQRIRLTTESAALQRLVGTLVSQDADSFRLQVAGHTAPVAIARSAVERLEISQGQRRATGKGWATGLGFGALTGMVVAARAPVSSCARGYVAFLCGYFRVLEGGAIGGAVGAVAGAALGSLVKTEHWEPASRGRIQVALAPQGAGLALSLTF